MSEITIHGYCDERFARVKQAFSDNFTQRAEIGACVSICLEGKEVVDLWGGFKDVDKQLAWQEDTLVNVWSVGKAISALTTLHAFEAFGVTPETTVASVWPEFASSGKQDISFATLMSHAAGLCAVSTPLPKDAFFDWDLMQQALAAQAPFWEPGTAHGYHTNTFGFLLGEPVRRLAGMRFKEYLKTAVTDPLGVDFFFGIDRSDLPRCADLVQMERPASAGANMALGSAEAKDPINLMRNLVYTNPALMPLGFNSEQWRMAEFPSTSPQSNARSVAHIMSALADILYTGQNGIVSYDLLHRAVQIHSDGEDRNVGRPTRFGLGFQLTQPDRPLGPGLHTFGHYGNGGHVGFADPDVPLGFAYHMNHQGYAWRDPRNIALIDATYESL